MTNIRIILFLLAGVMFFFLALRFQGKQLTSRESPSGIVSLELAGSSTQTAMMVDHWIGEGKIRATRQNILIDFLFIPFYALLFYTLCGSISVRHTGRAAKLGVLLAFFSLIAGFFDVCENLLMLLSTYGYFNNFTTMLTAFFAAAKFALLAVSLLYVITMGLPLLFRKLASR